MAGRPDGKAAFVTGGARWQGRSHAVRLALEGADIVLVDLRDQVTSVQYSLASSEDRAETVRHVEALDRRIIAIPADVRDDAGLTKVLY
jgi:(+)-trans-carveol dehydrogenase